MSSTLLNIVPAIPEYIPGDAQQEKARIFLTKFYDIRHIDFSVTDTIEFIDQGENFESVSCNVCGQNIEIETWQDQMDQAYQSQFTDLSFQTPCKHLTSLNDLNYIFPAAFARFKIAVSDAQNGLDKIRFEQLQEILGTKLRIVWAHY
jgi:transcription elongation factor Elf1